MDSRTDNSKNERPPQIVQKTKDQEFDEAVERVYRFYGSDLSAFARDVQRDMQKNHCVVHPFAVEPEHEG